MTRTELESYIHRCEEEHQDQLQITREAFSRFAIYEVVAKDCEDFATMDTDHLESLYSELEQAIYQAKAFLEQLCGLCETSRYCDMAEEDKAYYNKYPEDLEEE